MSFLISHIGSTKFPSSIPNHSVSLNYVIHTPILYHNLISIDQLCYDNHASIEYFHDSFLVKDLQSKTFLLKGNLDGSLYKLSIPHGHSCFTEPHTLPLALLSIIHDLSFSHHRPGHQSLNIIVVVQGKIQSPQDTRRRHKGVCAPKGKC